VPADPGGRRGRLHRAGPPGRATGPRAPGDRLRDLCLRDVEAVHGDLSGTSMTGSDLRPTWPLGWDSPPSRAPRWSACRCTRRT
jgi:hypothetical protein